MNTAPRAILASRTIFAKGLLNTILGAIHIAGAFTFEADGIAGQGTPELRRDYLVWFFGVGVFILFTGVVDLLCAKELKSGNRMAWKTSLASSAFVAIMGCIGVSLYGFSPPLQLLLTGIVGLAALTAARRERLPVWDNPRKIRVPSTTPR